MKLITATKGKDRIMALPKWIPNWVRWIINRIDTPVDKLKHFLWRDRKLYGDWRYRIRVPMSNKGYYGIEIAVYKKQQPAGDRPRWHKYL